ncbi:unnamed protein product, partial [Microthlaspi erraticum]
RAYEIPPVQQIVQEIPPPRHVVQALLAQSHARSQQGKELCDESVHSSTDSVPPLQAMSKRLTYREQQKALGKLAVGETSRAPPPDGDTLMANAAEALALARQSENENRASVGVEMASQVNQDNAAVVSSRSHDDDSNGSVRR